MTHELLNIHWKYAEEYISIPSKQSIAHDITTLERWKRYDTSVIYTARLERFDMSSERNILVLRYVRDDQKDPRTRNPDNNVRWGTSKITWQPQARKATARWTDDEGPDWSGPVQVDILGKEEPVDQFRATVSVVVKARPGQQALRDQLLCLDNRCAISNEEETTAIEAAHIVPVKAGGQEVISNAFLLRADLHRLFDAGLFWFEQSTDRAQVKHVAGLSQNYRDLLTDKSLPESTFERVKKALVLRSRLPGGNGPGVER